MTSISQTSGLQPQGQSTSSSAVSQGHSPIPSKSSPQTVTVEAATSTIGGSAPTQAPQHGKSPSVSLNGKHMQHPAPQVAGGLTIVNGNTAPNPSLHDRKTSVTINPNLIPNGGPAGASGRANNLRFGSMDSQGAPMNNPASLPNQPQSTLGVNPSMNPRTTSPQTSPSPIPQPIASGGRPPSSLQGPGNNLNFGSFGSEPGDMNRPNMRPVPQGPMGPNAQSSHFRRESTHSAHGDMGNHGMPGGPPGRGGYGHSGRGRSYGQPHQPMGYNSPGPTYRSTPNQPRGGPNMGFHGHNQRSLGPFPHSPRQAARSPALSNVNPATPPMSHVPMANTQMQAQHFGGYPTHMGPQQVKQQSSYPPKYSNRRSSLSHKHNGPRFKHQNAQRHFTPQAQFQYPQPPTLSPESGHFEQYLTMIKSQGFVAQGYDPNYYYQPSPYNMPQGQYQYIAPPSPRAAMNVPHPPQAPYMQAQYSNQGHPPPQATPLSRSPSQVSGPDRPGSSLGPAQQSVPMTQGPSFNATRSTSSPVQKSQFVVPTKKSSVVIKDPDSGKEMNFLKQSTSQPRTTPSPVKLGGNTPASTPPPRTGSRAEHERSDSKSMTGEEKKQSFQDAIAQKVRAEAEARKREEAEKAEMQRKEKEEAEAKARKETEGKKAAEEAEKAAATEKEKEQERQEAAAKEVKPEAPKAPVEAASAEDEIDWDALEKELAEKEAAAEKAYAEKKRKQQEEKARKEKEDGEAYIANLKKAEQEAEAAEEARIRKLEQGEEEGAKKERTDLFASLKNKGAQSPPSATESPIIRTPAESGAATPVSDISMGPPSKPASGGKRDKPAALKLETTKTVEPPQPSAAMKSLQTARFLEDPSKITYPPAIVSPNPALNANAPVDRKFKYNKEFLLQFQSVFKEKPSIDWDSRVRETVGDSTDSSSRPGSARTPIIGSGRAASRPGIQASFPNAVMGKFAQTPGRSQTLPPAGIGRDGFPMATGGHGPSMANPFGHFSRGPGGLPLGSSPMSRSSSSTMQQMPSPRAGSHRGQRSGSKRDKVSRKEEETNNKTMPLTANLDIKPLVPSQAGWKPRSVGQSLSGPALGGDGHMPPDVVQRKVKANLNKMTPEKFDRISDQILEIVGQSKDESDGRTLRQVIQLTFEKATDEAHWAPMYAKFCKRMLDSMSPEIKDENIRDKQGNVVTGGSLFRKYLLNRCQEEFERGWKINLPEKPEGVTEEAAMMSDEYYAAAAAKRRGLGLVKFIGELYKLGMLTERIMHQCVKKLVDYEGIPEEAEVESLTSLLRTIGYSLDNSEKGHGMMDAYFVRISMMMETPGLASRLKFMLMDIVDLRKAGWISKDGDKGPKTIVEIREAAARAQQEQEMERLRQQASRSGRMPMGRGDSRNFSGGYGSQAPPPDFASSKVGSDDLRRLKTTRNTNQPMSFGPSSMFGSRSSSGRKNLGPGGNLVRGGEDSGASSRTGTPPGGKDKKDDKEAASSVNAFSALAALNNEDNLATSPPSNPSSPPMVKSQPTIELSKPPAKEQEGRSTS
ncbi:translation initiation factor eIF4G [Histoplasma capsulatum H143]|uniref:Translation initiation factor eIF4G n=1 Tax=Ajellomyces capsulatus (strain H143) TaxID=544712 RepID=C6HHS8_AJECH|nr:translation initiation factor eIF4G [Histoplasma capsulatum H143]